MQNVTFITVRSTVSSSFGQPTSAETSCDSSGVQDEDKSSTLCFVVDPMPSDNATYTIKAMDLKEYDKYFYLRFLITNNL
jgi:hypothetical protein